MRSLFNFYFRFYFLSDDDLLEILSQTKDPTAVQPHLKKVFENINSIQFDDKRKILAMFSAEGEKVNFVKMVDPNNKNVEDWMGEVEDMMRQSVRAALLKSIEDYPNPERTKWCLIHPGQCVLNGSQVKLYHLTLFNFLSYYLSNFVNFVLIFNNLLLIF